MTKFFVKIWNGNKEIYSCALRKDVLHWDKLIVLNVSTSQHNRTFVSTFIFRKSISYPKQKKYHKCQLRHYVQIVSGIKKTDAKQLVGQINNESLKEELGTCKHFFIDSELEIGRYRVFNFAM